MLFLPKQLVTDFTHGWFVHSGEDKVMITGLSAFWLDVVSESHIICRYH